MQLHRSEVLIIGGGISGITTALDLLDGGKSVVLLDRDEASAFGGLARESFGGMFFVGRRSSAAWAFAIPPTWRCATGTTSLSSARKIFGPRAWAQAYVERCTTDIYRWVRSHGVRFLPVVNWVERGEFRPGNSVPRFHVTWGTGKGLAETLIGALRGHANAKRLTVHFRHRVERLLTRDGRVGKAARVSTKRATCRSRRAPRTWSWLAAASMADLDRVRQNWHRDWNAPPAKLLNGSCIVFCRRPAPTTRPVAAGGVVSHLDKMWNYAAGVHHPRPRQAASRPFAGAAALGAVAELARRADRTAASCVGLRHAPPRHRHLRAAAAIFLADHEPPHRAGRELAVSGAEHNPSIRDRKPLGFLRDILLRQPLAGEGDDRSLPGFRRCRDPAGAGGKDERAAGDQSVQLAEVQNAVGHYDATIARGRSLMNDEQLRRIAELRQYRGDRIRAAARFQRINDPRALPLIAVREFIISRKSLGGIRTDLHSRVLDAAGRPRSRVSMRSEKPQASVVAACTGCAHWRARSSAAAFFQGALRPRRSTDEAHF